MRDAPSLGRTVLRWTLRIALTLLVVTAVAAGYVYWQARRLTESLHADKPLVIERVEPPPAERKALRDRVKRSVAKDRRVVLTGPEVTSSLQEALADRTIKRRIAKGRADIAARLAGIDEPFGLVERVRLQDVDLDQLVADVALAEGRATVRATAPYLTGGGHLNVTAVVSGRYEPKAPELTVHSLRLGDLDLLGITGLGRRIRDELTGALLERARAVDPRGLREVSIDGDRLVVRVR